MYVHMIYMYVCSCLFGSFLFVANGISKGCGRSVRYLITSTTCNYVRSNVFTPLTDSYKRY